MVHTTGRIIDKHLAVEQHLDTKRETDDFAKFIVNDIDREILDSYVKPVLEKIGKSYLITPMNLKTVDDPSYNTIEVRKSVDITPVTKCRNCKFLKTETYMEEAGVWRKEYRCEMDHRPRGMDSFFCADGRQKEEAKEDGDGCDYKREG